MKKLLYICLISFIFLCLSCKNDNSLTEPLNEGVISGIIYTQNSMNSENSTKYTLVPLQNVMIKTIPNSNTAFTESSGSFILHNTQVGKNKVIASLEGYWNDTTDVETVNGSPNNIVSVLLPKGSTTGIIKIKASDTITKKQVSDITIYNSNATYYSQPIVSKDVAGNYYILGLAPGKYKFICNSSEYQADTSIYQVQAGRITKRNICFRKNNTSTIIGKVIDKYKRTPIQGVSIGLNGLYYETDKNGVFLIQNIISSPYQYTATFSKDGYQQTSAAFVANYPDTIYIPSVEMMKYSKISGTIIDSKTKLPITNAQVAISNISGNYTYDMIFKSDSKGKFAYNLLVSGSCNLSVSYPGYKLFTTSFNIYKDTVINVNIALTPVLLKIPSVTMIDVPAGTFNMGVSSYPAPSSPQHAVTLTNDFKIGKFEITNEQFCTMLNYANSKGYLTIYKGTTCIVYLNNNYSIGIASVNDGPQSPNTLPITYGDGIFYIRDTSYNSFPVTQITWKGAAFFCNMLNEQNNLSAPYALSNGTFICNPYNGIKSYRLPTEAEWEYVAQYNDGRLYPWGNSTPTKTICNYNSNNTVKVGSFSPYGDNKLGVCDLLGNVSEFCTDLYYGYSSSSSTNPANIGTSSTHVIRGGSYITTVNEISNVQRWNEANWDSPNQHIGFRIMILK